MTLIKHLAGYGDDASALVRSLQVVTQKKERAVLYSQAGEFITHD